MNFASEQEMMAAANSFDIDGIKKIKEIYPETDIIMLSVFNNSERIFKSICAGATGYALKDLVTRDREWAMDVRDRIGPLRWDG